MCGIAGFISPEKNDLSIDRGALLGRMCEVIAHRGPDDQGTVVMGRAALGMRRLAIIDLVTGHQPMFSDDKRYAIVFNGEIYNYRELTEDLESRGYQFQTNSDTETILHAFEAYGVDCVPHLRGMFAFAIWDSVEGVLFLARDRVGKKPLFYSLLPDGTFVFGSEIKSILLHPDVRREIDTKALDSYLTFGYVPESQCIFSGISKVQPGCFLRFSNRKIAEDRYWSFPLSHDSGRTSDQMVTELRGTLEESVRIRMISDVPLGAFLSGGIDSSAVVGLMSQISPEPVKTFSIGFNEDTFSELKYARIAADHFGTDHHEFIVTPDLVSIVDDLVWHFDEPFADPSSLPTYMVSKLAREHVTVVLSGDGGDELFAGYSRYLTYLSRSWTDRLPSPVKRICAKLADTAPERFPGKYFLNNLSHDPVGRYIDLVSHFNRQRREKLYSPAFFDRLNGSFACGESEFAHIASEQFNEDPLGHLLQLDSVTYLPSDVMVKVDRMSMASSLEARAPLLDHKLIELAAAIPTRFKLENGETKAIFKKVVSGLVPDEILYRQKQGFGVPIVEWINREFHDRIRETLLDGRATREYFNVEYIELLLNEHKERRRDHAYSLWLLFMLELWMDRYL